MELLRKLVSKQARVAVIGLGHAGLPLAIRAAQTGFLTTGIDVDHTRVESLSQGISYIADVTSSELSEVMESGNFTATLESDGLSRADVILISVPTPLRDGAPDTSYIENAAKEIARVLRKGQLVILESTTYPGTTEGLLKDALEESSLRAGPDFYLGFSAQRIDPGNKDFAVSNVPKLVGGFDQASAELMDAFYSTFIDEVHILSSPKAAETAKLLENTYRHVNIALINEMAMLCRDLGVDVWEVIDAAATKPFGFQAFYPGPGWGGHCIPVDPAYLSWRVRQLGETAQFVDLAKKINERMPAYTTERAIELLDEHGIRIEDSSILILGIAYKPDVPDARESPVLEVISRLIELGARVDYHDPLVTEIVIKGTSLRSVELTQDLLASFHLTIVCTDHSTYDWKWVSDKAKLIFDTRNALKGLEGPITRL